MLIKILSTIIMIISFSFVFTTLICSIVLPFLLTKIKNIQFPKINFKHIIKEIENLILDE